MVKGIANALQRGNERKEFVSEAVKNAGYPNWSHARITRAIADPGQGSSLLGSTEDSIVYIPFAHGDSLTDAVMAVRVGATDTVYSVIWQSQYVNFGFDTTGTAWNAIRLFMLFTEFDRSIYGRDKFLLTDGRVFGRDEHDTLHVLRMNESNGNDGSLTNSLIEISLCVVYQLTEYGENEFIYVRNNFYGSTPTYVAPKCATFYYYPTGGGIPPPSTIPEGVIWSQPPPPPSESGGGQWLPDDPTFFSPEPYDSLFARLSRFLNQHENKFDSLSYAQQSEYVMNIIDVAGSFDNVFDTCKLKKGNTQQVVPDLLVPSGKRLVAFYHDHFADTPYLRSDSTMKSGPSGGDVSWLWKVINNDPPVVCIVDAGPVRFFMIIENRAKANTFFHQSLTSPENFQTNWYNAALADPGSYTNHFTSSTTNVLLSFMPSISSCGIGIYKSTNTDKTEFIKLNP